MTSSKRFIHNVADSSDSDADDIIILNTFPKHDTVDARYEPLNDKDLVNENADDVSKLKEMGDTLNEYLDTKSNPLHGDKDGSMSSNLDEVGGELANKEAKEPEDVTKDTANEHATENESNDSAIPDLDAKLSAQIGICKDFRSVLCEPVSGVYMCRTNKCLKIKFQANLTLPFKHNNKRTYQHSYEYSCV